MSYKNTSSLGYEVEMQLLGGYNVNSHGDLGAFYNSLSNADLPRYTALFYSATPHEQIAELKYDKVLVDYDKGLQDFKESLRGPPLEAYIPSSFMAPDGVGGTKLIRNAEIMPKRTIVDEILKAQEEILGKPVVLRVIQEEIHIKRLRIISQRFKNAHAKEKRDEKR